MAGTFIRSSPAVPICSGSVGSLALSSGPRRPPSGNPQAAWPRTCTHGAVSPAAALPASPRAALSPLPRRVRIVESDQPRAVRSFRARLGAQRDEPHPGSGPVGAQRPAVKAGRRTTGRCRSPGQGAALSVPEPRVRRSAPLQGAPLAADGPLAGSLAASAVTIPGARRKADAQPACRIIRASGGCTAFPTRAGVSWRDGKSAAIAGEGRRRGRTGDPWPCPRGVGWDGAIHHPEDGSQADSCATRVARLSARSA